MSLRFEIGERVFCAACAHCQHNVALFPDASNGRGAAPAPLTGAFAFECTHCGGANESETQSLTRCSVGEGATAGARIFVPVQS